MVILFGYIFTGVVQYSNLRLHFFATSIAPFFTVAALFAIYPTEISKLFFWISIPYVLWLSVICLQLNARFRRHILLRISHEALNAEVIKARDEAISANKAKSTFLATMSHELRTPLNSIIGFSEILMKSPEETLQSGPKKDFIENIHDSGTHLLSIINDVLDLAKIEAGRMELERHRLALPDIMQTILRLLTTKIEAEAFEVNVLGADAIDPVEADERAIRQIFFNLVSNALKYSREVKKIDISFYQDADRVFVGVSDRGVGIPPEIQEHLFTPFHQANNAYGDQREGTGLGLSVVKGLMDLHDGTVTLSSSPGDGTTVTLGFPREKPITPPSPAPKT